MRSTDDRNSAALAAEAVMLEGSVSVPALLLKYYRTLRLSDGEAMLLIHLIAFREKEGTPFPTLEDIQRRMASPPDTVVQMLQNLLNGGFIQIDDETDPLTGIRSERYNLRPLYRKLADAWAAERRKSAEPRGAANPDQTDIFTIFEKEFARPLTPMECETIAHWLDVDRYPEPLIVMALKEAVFSGKVHFRYIDRILLEWSRNRVTTPEEARQFIQKFRGAR